MLMRPSAGLFITCGLCAAWMLVAGCSSTKISREDHRVAAGANATAPAASSASYAEHAIPEVNIRTGNVDPRELVSFAKTLIGVPYRYGSMIKEQGFDCSGFINYVFRHFHISTPRSSVDFTNAGTPVSLLDSRAGDLILFTGTDTTGRVVGHMGIITENHHGKLRFIHSSSGRNIGVIISPLSSYYAMRLVKVIRIFPDGKYGE